MGQRAAIYERAEGAAHQPLGASWKRREPEKTVLHQVVCANLSSVLAELREEDADGPGLPLFVEKEFRRYLDCGILKPGLRPCCLPTLWGRVWWSGSRARGAASAPRASGGG